MNLATCRSTDQDIRTVLADRTRAIVEIGRDLDSEGIHALEQVLDDHYFAGRRFLRIRLAGVRTLSGKLVALLERTHYRMLASRGTAIVVGAGPEVMRALSELGLDKVLLVAEANADERPSGRDAEGGATPATLRS